MAGLIPVLFFHHQRQTGNKILSDSLTHLDLLVYTKAASQRFELMRSMAYISYARMRHRTRIDFGWFVSELPNKAFDFEASKLASSVIT